MVQLLPAMHSCSTCWVGGVTTQPSQLTRH